MSATTERAPLVIVGSGLAAYSLAREWRKLDSDTPLVIITSDDGAGYYKPNLSNALSKQQTADDLIQTTAAQAAEQYQAQILTHTDVVAIDTVTRNLHLSQGQPLSWGRLVLAVGAEPMHPPLEGDAVDQVHSINDRADFAAFQTALAGKRRVTIMGAGLIGCEFANDLAGAGYDVEVAAPSESLLTGLVPPAIGQALQTELEAQGIRFHLGPLASRVDHEADGSLKVSLTNGRSLHADVVLSAVGLTPRVRLARQAGLAVHKGIMVDRTLQSSQADIYALGDCAEVEGLSLMYILPLTNAARALAKTLAGEPTEVNWPAMPVTVKTPACPVVAYPPKGDGEWKIEGSGANLAAVCRHDETVLGFALCGDRIKERNTWLKAVPPLLAT
ncbi:FAD-dependent oxidoreductase [Saccharospirillum mangrovi]|uniref:FAD-dependent oxidoreductase n=1 Tax=Saccharospirillum mangrovi TaxID=2161747 RepID=UPI000D35A1C1|nr:FAD-dependent oxidoreductase [Saccharospirillum mangrovi]